MGTHTWSKFGPTRGVQENPRNVWTRTRGNASTLETKLENRLEIGTPTCNKFGPTRGVQGNPREVWTRQHVNASNLKTSLEKGLALEPKPETSSVRHVESERIPEQLGCGNVEMQVLWKRLCEKYVSWKPNVKHVRSDSWTPRESPKTLESLTWACK